MTNSRAAHGPSIRRTFADADWSFSNTALSQEFHPYPARFVSQIPAQALDLVEPGSGSVLDPFCGSGTTLAEAQRRGLDSVGIDINPIACLISRVRVSRWSPGDAVELEGHKRALYAACLAAEDIGDEFRDIPRLDHWFPDYAQRALSGAVRYVRTIDQDNAWRDRAATSVSAATVRVSRQDSDTRYAAVDKAGDQESVARALAQSLQRTGQWLQRNTADYSRDAVPRVLMQDARDMSEVPDESVGVACFSPPYPNAYEYWLYHKYRMYWLGFDAVEVREREIGARPHYCKANGLTEDDFAAQMTEVFLELGRVLRPDGVVVVVVGDSVIGGRQIDNGELLCGVAEGAGLSTVYTGTRPIAVRRSSFNRAHSRGRTSEHILVFKGDT